MIQHPLGSRKFALREPQIEALKRWSRGEDSLTLKARQIGWSTLIGFFVWHVAFFNPEAKIIVLSKGEREAQELLDKVKFGLDRIPPWLKQRGPTVTARTMSKITFSNDSEIVSLPSGNNPARGFTGRVVVVDEWAFLPNPEEAWASIEPVTDIGGQIIGLSTANGSGNLFHSLWTAAEEGLSSFKPMFYGWDAVPERDDDWYEGKKRSLPQWQLHQEYPASPREAFIKSGAMVYDADMLEQYEPQIVDAEWVGNLAATGMVELAEGETPNPKWWTPSENADGFLTVWQKPAEHGTYVIGADVAEGLGHGDYSSAHVLDVETGKLVAVWHGHIPADLFGVELAKLGYWYNTALIIPEVNNHGLTTVTEMRRWSYPRLWRRRQLNSARGGWSIEYGWKTTKVSKPLLVDELGQFLREQVTVDGSMPDGRTLAELMTYVRDARGGMNGSPHDDRVISYGLAVQALKYAFAPEYQDNLDPPEGSLAWWDELLDDQRDDDLWTIGVDAVH